MHGAQSSESSSSGVTRDMSESSHNELRHCMWNGVYLRCSLETRCPGLLLVIFCRLCAKTSGSEKESRCWARITGHVLFRHLSIRVAGALNPARPCPPRACRPLQDSSLRPAVLILFLHQLFWVSASGCTSHMPPSPVKIKSWNLALTLGAILNDLEQDWCC